MEEPLTEELLNELLSSQDPAAYLGKHQPVQRDLASYLQELLESKGLERKDVVNESQINYTYGYQLFTGRRTNPARDMVLQIAFAMHLTLRETDRLLQAAGVSRLYCKDRRDAIVVFCLSRGLSLSETNETLFAYGERILGD